ncbi:hypothetical protein ACIBSW_36660 [Actinoplanes sp. NPDC049668]|uniref:hypothetical protein n=1 Tax=unclassified Actinoplanes TaxID=2626549 RepID=UPI0033A45EE3
MPTTATPRGRTTSIDRIARWALDPDGDLYGDERERLHWYEGIAVAASIQWLAVPWVAAVMVWSQGRDAVTPLAAVLAALYLPVLITGSYVQRRRIETTPTIWSRKRVILTVLHTLPYLLFAVGAMYFIVDSATFIGAGVGILVGAVVGILILRFRTVRRRRRDAAYAAAGDVE